MKLKHITDIDILNFQSHENTHISLADGLNVIVGPSDQGKTAIIRALRWVLYNEPRGSDFIRIGHQEAKVKVAFSDGYVITRERGTNYNRYIVTHPDGNDQVFEGFGTDIPEEVLLAHGMGKVTLDSGKTTSVNLGLQLDPAFLLSESGSTKAKSIGRLIGVHVIDAAIRTTQRDLQRILQDERRLKQEADEVVAQLETFADLPDLETQIRKGEIIQSARNYACAKLDNLTKVELQWHTLLKMSNELNHTLQALFLIPSAEIKINLASEEMERVRSLSRLHGSWSRTVSSKHGYEMILSETASVEKVQMLTSILHNRVSFRLQLLKFHNRGLQLSTEIIAQQNSLEKTSLLPRAMTMIQQVDAYRIRLSKINLTSIKKDHLSAEEVQTRNLLNELKVTESAGIILEHLDQLLPQEGKLKNIHLKYREIATRIENGKQYVSKIDASITTLSDQYQDALTELGYCPLCLQPVNTQHLPHILDTITQRRS